MSSGEFDSRSQPFITPKDFLRYDIPPAAADQTVQYIRDWADRATSADPDTTTELVVELELTLAEAQATHPNSGAWDTARVKLACEMHNRGALDLSYDITHSIKSPHLCAQMLLWYVTEHSDEASDLEATRFLDRSNYIAEPVRWRKILLAMYDLLVYVDPDRSGLDVLEARIEAEHDGNWDPVVTWQESQSAIRQLDDEYLEEEAAIIRDEDWGDVPLRNRLHLMMRYYLLVGRAPDGLEAAEDAVIDMEEAITTQSRLYPDSRILAKLQFETTVLLLDLGLLDRALSVVRLMQDEGTLDELAEIFAERGVDIYIARQAPPPDSPANE